MEIEKMFGGFYRGKKVLLTGHTGFKGKWMHTWLEMLGAEVVGFSLPDNNINSSALVFGYVNTHKPDIVIHMAAVAQVIPSVTDPDGTFYTNVVGTFNVLQACRAYGVARCLVVSSDKVYSNTGANEGKMHDIDSSLGGGLDPYSGSKAAADLLTQEYRKHMSQTIVNIVRAGNVIGGGDQSTHRLIPNIIESLSSNVAVELRCPDAVRPWQHVLDVVYAYLSIIYQSEMNNTWNVGPQDQNARVSAIYARICRLWRGRFDLPALAPKTSEKFESGCLRIDPSRTKNRFDIQNIIDINGATYLTVEWYNAMLRDGTDMTETQIRGYCDAVRFIHGQA